MPAHKKPTNVLELTGRLKHDGKRHQDRTGEDLTGEAISRGIGDAPAERFITFQEAWDDIVSMAPDGVLCHRDRAVVEQAARLHQQLRNHAVLVEMEGRLFVTSHTPTVKVYMALLAKLGMSPVDSLNVQAPAKPPQAGDDW